jgi:hypothetical protein
MKVVASLSRKKTCRQDRHQTVTFRIIQLGALDYYDERKRPIVFQGQRLKHHL